MSAKPVTPWASKDEILVFMISGLIGAIIGANLLKAYRAAKP